jgi:hypothetical protein
MTSQHAATAPFTPRSQSHAHSFLCSQDNNIDYLSLTTLHHFRQSSKFLTIVSITCPELHNLVMLL